MKLKMNIKNTLLGLMSSLLLTAVGIAAIATSANAEPLYVGTWGQGAGTYDATTGAPINRDLFLNQYAEDILLVGNTLYLTGPTVRSFNATTGALINGNVFPGTNALDIAIQGNILFVPDNTTRKVRTYDATTGVLINASFADYSSFGFTAFCIFVTGNDLYLGGMGGSIAKFDATTGALVNPNFMNGFSFVTGMAVLGNEFYVSDANQSRVGKYNATTGAVINPTFVTGVYNIWDVAISGNDLYVASPSLRGVFKYNAATGVPINSFFLSGRLFSGLAFEAPNNNPPTADAGADQSIRAGDTVDLDGSGSDDDNTASASLVYSWTFTSVPMGSMANLNAANTATPSFVADVNGTYVLELVVTDEGGLPSLADEVEISSNNLAPTAAAGDDQLVVVGNLVSLDGSGSSDPEMDALTYSWNIVSAPGSIPALDDANSTMPSFTPVDEGVYVLSLDVSDFLGSGTPDTVEIMVTSASGFAENRILGACEIVESLSPGQVTTKGNQNAFCNFLGKAIKELQKSPPNTAKAIEFLEKAIERTDGCVLRMSPDGNGGGRDWITDCAVQLEAYQLLNDALSALTAP